MVATTPEIGHQQAIVAQNPHDNKKIKDRTISWQDAINLSIKKTVENEDSTPLAEKYKKFREKYKDEFIPTGELKPDLTKEKKAEIKNYLKNLFNIPEDYDIHIGNIGVNCDPYLFATRLHPYYQKDQYIAVIKFNQNSGELFVYDLPNGSSEKHLTITKNPVDIPEILDNCANTSHYEDKR